MNNPQAFPIVTTYDDVNGILNGQEGMTLRDYFAGQAMCGMGSQDIDLELNAKYCYKIADAMLKERGKHE